MDPKRNILSSKPASISQALKFSRNYSVTSCVCICMGILRRPSVRSQAVQASRSRCIGDHIHPTFSRIERSRRTASRCLFEQQRTFSPISELRLDEFSYNYTPCTFDACPTYFISLVAICR